MPTVAITGASGFVGGHLVEHFAGRGWDVVALARSPVAGGERVRWARYDLAAPPADRLLAGVDALVHAAYVKADASPDAYRLNVDGTAALLRALPSRRVPRAVFLSSLSARPGATSVYARQKLDAEALFAADGDAVIRAGLVLGPGGLVGDTVALMRRVRVVPLIGGGRQPVQPVGVEDLATIVERIVTRDDLTGTFVVADPAPTTAAALYRAIARAIGLRVLFVPVPRWTRCSRCAPPAACTGGSRSARTTCAAWTRRPWSTALRASRGWACSSPRWTRSSVGSAGLHPLVELDHHVPFEPRKFRRSPATGPCWRRGSPAGSPRSRS